MPIPNAARARSITHIISAVLVCTTALACNTDANSNDLTKLPQFQLSATPTFTLTDDSTAQRTWTRISARRLPSGDVAIADEPALNIRI